MLLGQIGIKKLMEAKDPIQDTADPVSIQFWIILPPLALINLFPSYKYSPNRFFLSHPSLHPIYLHPFFCVFIRFLYLIFPKKTIHQRKIGNVGCFQQWRS